MARSQVMHKQPVMGLHYLPYGETRTLGESRGPVAGFLLGRKFPRAIIINLIVEIMNTLFIILFLLSFAGFIAGLIRPQWLRMPSRTRVAHTLGIASVIFLIILIVRLPSTSQTNTPTQTSNAPAESQNRLHGDVQFKLDQQYGYGYITTTNKDTFDWKNCVFSDTPLAKTNPHDVPSGQSIEIGAINFMHDSDLVKIGVPVNMSNTDFIQSKTITMQCDNGQAEIDNVYQSFNKLGGSKNP